MAHQLEFNEGGIAGNIEVSREDAVHFGLKEVPVGHFLDLRVANLLEGVVVQEVIHRETVALVDCGLSISFSQSEDICNLIFAQVLNK